MPLKNSKFEMFINIWMLFVKRWSLEGKLTGKALNFSCLLSCRLKQRLTELVRFTSCEAATEQQ